MKFSLDRHREMKGSNRRSELESVTAVEVVDPLTVRLRLKAPFSPLTAQLADRAGMPVSPAADKKLGEKFGTAPVCVGPWQFVERVPQDRIVVERSPHYFDQAAAKFDRIVVPHHPRRQRPPGQPALGRHRRHAPGHAHRRRQPQEGRAVRGLQRHRPRLQLDHDQPQEQDGQDQPARRPRHAAGQRPARARGARAVDRPRGARTRSPTTARTRSAAGPSRPTASFFDKSRKCPTRDVARAKKLLADAGLAERLQPSRWSSSTTRSSGGWARSSRAWPREAGFNISLRPAEFASALKDNDDGKHQAFLIGWSGRVDPDGNIHQGQACGGSLNATLACDEKIDALLNKAREVTDIAQRRGALPRGHRPHRAPGATRSTSITRTTSWPSPRTSRATRPCPTG